MQSRSFNQQHWVSSDSEDALKEETKLMEEGERKEEIRQTTMVLPYFDYEIPVLLLQDGSTYIPVIELCMMLGLRADTHMSRWRTLLFWKDARKLPYHTPRRGRRVVWCLPGGALLFWYGCFDWSLVSLERQAQLRQATDEGIEVLAQFHQQMLSQYRRVRQQLFEFVTAYAETDTTLPRLIAAMHVYLNDFEACIAWEELMSQVQTCVSVALAHARKMLQEQGAIPVVDAVKVNAAGEVIEEMGLPLFPIVPTEDVIRFYEYLKQLAQWSRQLMDFLATHGVRWDGEQKRWYLASEQERVDE
jgi:hypothetical protein